jgi:hypothetical protein
VIANANGVFPAIFLQGAFNVALKDSNNVQIWTADPVTSNPVGSIYATTLDLISSDVGSSANEIVTCEGYTTKGDGGGAQWKQNGVTGQTASQSPTQLGDALLNDANGNQWALQFGKTVILEKLGGAPAFQAALNTRAAEIAWFSSILNLEPVRLIVYSGQHIHGPGIEKSTLNINVSMSKTNAQFENEHLGYDVDNIRRDKNIKFSGFTIDGSARVYASWLSNLAGDTITNPEFDYTAGGIIGLGGDIFDVVAADRRNANYSIIGGVISIVKAEYPIIENVRCTGHASISFLDLGCLSMRIRNCQFDNQGKIDNISSAVWAQSFDNPTSPGVQFQDTEDHVTEYCKFSCKRSAISLTPTKGGAFRFNTLYNTGESSVFSGTSGNFNGGRIDVHGNIFGPTVLTDLVGAHIESKNISNYHVHNNSFKQSDTNCISLKGCHYSSIYNNTIENAVMKSVSTHPYGPFSERFAFNIGSASIAGDPLGDSSPIAIGTNAGKGTNGLDIYSNHFIDDRATSLAISLIKCTKADGSNLSKNVSIHNNFRDLYTDTTTPLIHLASSNIFDAEMSFSAYDNSGDASGEAQTVSTQIAIGGTGTQIVDIGFRPRRLSIYAALNNGASLAGYVGEVNYKKTAGIFGTAASVGDFITIIDDAFFRVVDNAGSVVCRASFGDWTETGFSYSIITADSITNLRIVCHP